MKNSKEFYKVYHDKTYKSEFFDTIKKYFNTLKDDNNVYECIYGYQKRKEGYSEGCFVGIEVVSTNSIINL